MDEVKGFLKNQNDVDKREAVNKIFDKYAAENAPRFSSLHDFATMMWQKIVLKQR